MLHKNFTTQCKRISVDIHHICQRRNHLKLTDTGSIWWWLLSSI